MIRLVPGCGQKNYGFTQRVLALVAAVLAGAASAGAQSADPRASPSAAGVADSAPLQPAREPPFIARPVQSVWEAQIALARQAISPGPVDGLMGPQTRAALRAFQQFNGLPASGDLDPATMASLWLHDRPVTNYVITAADIARLRPVPDTWLGKSQAATLEYETLPELIAERGWAFQSAIRRLNPALDLADLREGVTVQIPLVSHPQFATKAATVRIRLAQRLLQAFDQDGRLMVHFPCSIARRVEKRPLGELRVSVLVPNPDYTFDPEVFTESEEGRQLGRKLRVPPGPNNPVGLAWIGLNLPGYGIHGTPDPEKVGRTESHGCFRLANWNAQLLLELSWEGLPVVIEP